MPVARPTRAKLMKKIATAPTARRKGSAPRKWFEATVRAAASTSTGTTPIQNFDHRNARIDTGEGRTTQNAAPSAETEGNTKRTATAESTNAAMARFTNA